MNGRPLFLNLVLILMLPCAALPQNPPADPFVQEVRALPADQQLQRVIGELKKLNPGYDGREQYRIEQGEVVELSFATETIKDISPLRALTSLRFLSAIGENSDGQISNLTPLKNLKLSKLAIQGNQVSDLSPLRGMPLRNLYINRMIKIESIEPLRGMPLQSLNINFLKINDWSPLQGMPLKDIYFGNSKKPPSEELLRGIPTLEKINNMTAAEYFRMLKKESVAAQPAPGNSDGNAGTPAEKLKILKRALEQGLLSKEDYDKKVKAILEGI